MIIISKMEYQVRQEEKCRKKNLSLFSLLWESWNACCQMFVCSFFSLKGVAYWRSGEQEEVSLSFLMKTQVRDSFLVFPSRLYRIWEFTLKPVFIYVQMIICLVCIRVLPECMSVQHMHALPGETRRVYCITWDWRYQMVVNHLSGCWELKPVPLEEQLVFFMVESLLHAKIEQKWCFISFKDYSMCKEQSFKELCWKNWMPLQKRLKFHRCFLE